MGEAKSRAAQRAKARAERTIPENLDRLDAGERSIRQLSIDGIHGAEDMMDHVELLEAVMDHIDFHVVLPPADADQETIQLLGARGFNDLASAYGQMLRGYYQISAMVMRDVMEIVFLLGMFERDRSCIREWRELDEAERKKKFRPVKVREFLDTFDGFQEQNRRRAYDMFCDYAAHPTPAGFELMGPTGGGKRTIGPFFDEPLLRAMLVELAQLAAQLGNYMGTMLDRDHSIPAMETSLRRLEVTGRWAERYLGRKFEHREFAEMRATLEKMKLG